MALTTLKLVATTLLLVSVLTLASSDALSQVEPIDDVWQESSLSTTTQSPDTESVEFVASQTVTSVLSVVTPAFMGSLQCAKDKCSSKDSALAVAKPIITAALNQIPFVGPLLGGLVSLFGGAKSQPSIWDQIKDQVDVAIGTALVNFAFDQVGSDVNTLVQQMNAYVQTSDGTQDKRVQAQVIESNLQLIANRIQVNFDGKDNPDRNAGGADDNEAKQRSLLVYLPQVALMELSVRLDRLEDWNGAETTSNNLNNCQVRLTDFGKRVSLFVDYTETAVKNYIKWVHSQNKGGQKAISGCDPRIGCLGCSANKIVKPTTLPDAPGPFDGNVHNGCDNCWNCDKTCNNCPADYNAGMQAWSKYYADKQAKYDKEYLEPMHQWNAFAKTITDEDFCSFKAKMSREGVNGRISAKEFAIQRLCAANPAPECPAPTAAPTPPPTPAPTPPTAAPTPPPTPAPTPPPTSVPEMRELEAYIRAEKKAQGELDKANAALDKVLKGGNNKKIDRALAARDAAQDALDVAFQRREGFQEDLTNP